MSETSSWADEIKELKYGKSVIFILRVHKKEDGYNNGSVVGAFPNMALLSVVEDELRKKLGAGHAFTTETTILYSKMGAVDELI